MRNFINEQIMNRSWLTKPRWWVVIGVLVLALVVAGFALPKGWHQLSGTARVVDGDTIAIGEERVRFLCINAPEVSEPEGPKATEYLRNLIGDRQVNCKWKYRDVYGRVLAWCYAGYPSLNKLMGPVSKCTCKWFCK